MGLLHTQNQLPVKMAAIMNISASARVAPKVQLRSASSKALKAKPAFVAKASFRVNATASDDTLTKVRTIISEQLGTDLDAAADAKFVDLGADSLDTVEIMMALEEQFEITLDE